jgi:prevent-host-death family protein
MSTIIGLKELREHTGDIINRVNKGESFVVVRRTTPVFEVRPVSESIGGSDQAVSDWTRQFVNRYRKTIKSLEDK